MPPPPRAHPPLPAAAREVYLASRPTGAISPSQNFGTRTAALPAAPLPPSTALVRALYVSVDPAMRGWMSDARSYVRPVAIGERMRAAGVAEVVGAGAGAGFSVGDLV
jgi:NADPH-dependent curcumin reductase